MAPGGPTGEAVTGLPADERCCLSLEVDAPILAVTFCALVDAPGEHRRVAAVTTQTSISYQDDHTADSPGNRHRPAAEEVALDEVAEPDTEQCRWRERHRDGGEQTAACGSPPARPEAMARILRR